MGLPFIVNHHVQLFKAMRKLSSCSRKTVIHCPTHKEYLALCNLLRSEGFVTKNYKPFGVEDFWSKYEEHTCICPIMGIHGPLVLFKGESIKGESSFVIFPASDFVSVDDTEKKLKILKRVLMIQ